MAKRVSNKERVQRAALEAELTAKEDAEKKKVTKKSTKKAAKKTTKKVAKKATTRKKTAASSGGALKVVWKVFDPASKEVGVFPYPLIAKAEEWSAHLNLRSGKEYRVRGVKIPLDEVI